MTGQETPDDLRHIALVRGINVGGRRRLPMADLAAIFGEAGAGDVRTYIQSGNVVFTAPAERAATIGAAAGELIGSRFPFRPPVVIRTGAEWAAMVTTNPFLRADADIGSLHVAFLPEVPDPERVTRLDPQRSPGDALVVRGRDVYLHLPTGLARSKIGSAYLDSALRTTSTVRNWRTVLALLEMVRGDL